MQKKLRIYNVKWTSRSAGPSPDNIERTEVFLAGCKKAINGEPCKGCFNPDLWSDNNFVAECIPAEAAENIIAHSPNKYITFVGGEPLDQIEALAETCLILKNNGFHIIVFSHFKMQEIVKMEHSGLLLDNIDILIDGEYDETARIFDDEEYEDGFHNAIGSGNQVIWDLKEWQKNKNNKLIGVPAQYLVCLFLNLNNDLCYVFKNEYADKMAEVTINAGVAA